MLLIPVTIILILVLAAITSPFWRKDPNPFSPFHNNDQTQELADLSVERETLVRSLQELDVELAQTRMEPEDHARLKATDEHRLLQVLDRLESLEKDSADQATSAQPNSTGKRLWIPATLCAVVVILSSLGTYLWVQVQALEKLTAAQAQTPGGGNGPNPLEMVAKLEKRLSKNPDDLEGQIMAGRSYQVLNRFEEAQKAWTKVLELQPRNNEAAYNLGVILIESRKFDDPEMFNTALKYFDKVLIDRPNEPGVNWYRGLALWYLKRTRETEEAWALAFKNLDPASPDAQFVKDALEKLRAGKTPF
ncbi:MAG: tetratricopeptide repeat protein [Nitrospirales bacterium]